MALSKLILTVFFFTFFVTGCHSQQNNSSGLSDFIEKYANTWDSFFSRLARLSGNDGLLIFSLPRVKYASDPIPIENNFKIPPLKDVKTYVRFAAAAYCSGTKLTDWTCADCTALGSDVKLVDVFNNETTGTQAYFAVNEHKKELILSFRGTANLKNVRDDVKVELVPVDGGREGLKVHRGAWEVLLSLYPHISCSLRSLLKKYPGYKIIITGHSLGGMVASLAFYQLKTDSEFKNLEYSLYSYAAARSGNLAFAQWINSQHITGIRVVSGIDIIPHLIQPKPKGYVHHLRELWVHRTFPIIWKSHNKLCSGKILEDPKCAVTMQDKLYLNVLQHVHYWDVFLPPLDCIQDYFRLFLN